MKLFAGNNGIKKKKSSESKELTESVKNKKDNIKDADDMQQESNFEKANISEEISESAVSEKNVEKIADNNEKTENADTSGVAVKRSFFEQSALFITYMVTMVLNSFVLRAFTVKFGDSKAFLSIAKAIVKPMLADIVALTIIGIFSFLFRKQKSRFKYLMIWTVIFSILTAGNSIYYTNYKSFLSVSLVSTASQLGGVMDAVTKNILEAKDWTMLFPIPVMIIVYVIMKKKHEKGYTCQKLSRKGTGKCVAVPLVVALCCGGIFSTMLTATDCSRLVKQWNRGSVMSSFGMYVYQISDTISSINAKMNVLFGYEENKQHFDEFFDSKSDDTTSQVVDETSAEKSNDYSGIFEGKNVLVIHAESIQQFTMDTYFNGEELTPNLNKLASEGIYFSNFYAQESVGTSSDSEFTFSTSLLPASSGTVAINYWDRHYATVQKSFGDMGYYVFSMHGNNGSYWNRLNLHQSLGYDRLYNYTTDFDIDETIGLGLSDKSFFRQAVPKIKEIAEQNDNFYGTLIMLTNHTPFTDIEQVSDFEVNFKYKQYNQETGLYEEVTRSFLEGTKLGSYFKSVHYADEAIGQLIDELDEEGLLDNTVLVIYGDHDSKIKEEEYEYYYNYNPFTDTVLTEGDDGYIPVDEFYYNLNRKVPFIIWSKDGGYEPTEVTKLTGMYDVRPTLANMFGFSSKYALGHDIFSISDDEDNIVILPSGNFITDKVYYDSQNDAYFDLTDYKNVAIYASCNQEYKDDPLPMYTEQKEGLYKFSQSEFGVQNVEARLNNGVVDSSYIEDRVTYATERIDISNTIIYYDMIYRHGDFNDDLPEDNSNTNTRTPFTPPDTVKRKEVFAV